MSETSSVAVMTRVRPFNWRELKISRDKGEQFPNCVVQMNDNTVSIIEHYRDNGGFRQTRIVDSFQYDECFWSLKDNEAENTYNKPFADQKFVYERTGLIALKNSLEGYPSTIFAYGQTGSGKTHSMLGNAEDPGISPRMCDDLYRKIAAEAASNPTKKIIVETVFFEIYNEKVRDLYNKMSNPEKFDAPRIRQHPTRGTYVDGLLRKEVTSADEIKALLEKGTSERAMSETKMNKTSSRSHAVFQIWLTQNDASKGTQTISSINLVDLAGSEKVRDSGVTGDAFKEATKINLSLSSLRKVIDCLIDNATSKKKKVPPYRESVLTYVLSEALGGNSKTQMMTAISPHEVNVEDTLNTLRYALRAKAIVCTPKVSEEKNAAMMDNMRDELLKLREALANGVAPAGAAVAGAGGEGRPMMPEEIKREIEIREQEVAKMEVQQKEMESLLEEQKKREEQLNLKMADMETQQHAIDLKMQSQRQERFALAFRNAFKITSDKKVMAVANKELDAAREKNQYYERRIEILEEALANRNNEYDEQKENVSQLKESMALLKMSSQQEIFALQQQNTDAETDRLGIQEELALVRRTLDRLRDDNLSTQQRFEKMQMAASSSARRVELASAEKTKVTHLYEQEIRDRDEALVALRKSKDRYKSMMRDEQAKNATLKQAKDEYETRHVELQHTIRALHALVRDREALVSHLQKQIEETQEACVTAKSKAEQRLGEVNALREAVDEYSKASLQWMSEHRAMEREVLQLRLQLGVPSLPRPQQQQSGLSSTSSASLGTAAVVNNHRSTLFQTATPAGALSRMMMEQEGLIAPLLVPGASPNASTINRSGSPVKIAGSSLRREGSATPNGARSGMMMAKAAALGGSGMRVAAASPNQAAEYHDPTYFVVGGGGSEPRGRSPRRWRPAGGGSYL